MPAYVLLSRLNTETQKKVVKNPAQLKKIREVLEQWEATIIADFHVLGPHDHCTIFEVSDNFRAQRAVLNLEATSSPDSMLLPAIDLPLFQRMVKQEMTFP